jgi:hypothetical protein
MDMPIILQVMMVPAYVAQKLNQSTQEETDSRVVLYCFYGKQQGYRNIRIRSPDTDIFFILLHYALELQGVTILFDTGTGNKKRLIDITKLAQQYQQELCTALLGLHAFTRCDITSAFKGIEKVKPINLRHYKSHPNSKVLLHKLEIPGKSQRICFCRWRLLPACCMAVKRSPV